MGVIKAFIAKAEAFARTSMAAINPPLADKYANLIKLLAMNPEAASKMRGNNSPAVGTEAYIRAQAASFSSSRVPRAPEPPATVPDGIGQLHPSQLLQRSRGKSRARQERAPALDGCQEVGRRTLERYLASVMEPRGWIWCSGSTVKAVDLIKPPAAPGGAWKLLQVKNRDNSENSSSSAIRNGTDIRNAFARSRKRPARIGEPSRCGNSPARFRGGLPKIR